MVTSLHVLTLSALGPSAAQPSPGGAFLSVSNTQSQLMPLSLGHRDGTLCGPVQVTRHTEHKPGSWPPL